MPPALALLLALAPGASAADAPKGPLTTEEAAALDRESAEACGRLVAMVGAMRSRYDPLKPLPATDDDLRAWQSELGDATALGQAVQAVNERYRARMHGMHLELIAVAMTDMRAKGRADAPAAEFDALSERGNAVEVRTKKALERLWEEQRRLEEGLTSRARRRQEAAENKVLYGGLGAAAALFTGLGVWVRRKR
ncbi:hypothetical protein EPO15_18310 [bacterium]|nr:MAG: hypothetical protein EPO15_18310 [bacterium]